MEPYRLDQLKALAQVARKYRVILLSDEIYGELHHKSQHISVARFYPEGTIISGGLSKWCGAGGWRLGTFTFPNTLHWLLDAMAAVASETYTSTSAPIQYAAVRAFEGGIDIEYYLAQSRRILKTLGRQLYHMLKQADVSVIEPMGAFYLFPNFNHQKEKINLRGVNSSKEFCKRLLEETGVAILPGSDFGRAPDELTARMAYVDFDGARALESAEEIPMHKSLNSDFIKTHFEGIIMAAERLCEWIETYT